MNQNKLRVLFAGTSDIAVPSLQALNKIADIVGVLTSPDRRSGRGLSLHYSAVKEEALSLGISEIIQPEKLDSDARETIKKLNADIMVVFAYGKIFGPKFLALFSQGSINIHPSDLPRYRGPAPLMAAIINQDKAYGISIQKVALGVDCGDIVASNQYPLIGDETLSTLHSAAAINSAELLATVWPDILSLIKVAQPQDESKATHVSMIQKEEGLIDWTQSAQSIEAAIRAHQPWPKSWTFWNETKLFIYKAKCLSNELDATTSLPGSVVGIDSQGGIQVQCGIGIVEILELQLQSKKRLDCKTFYNGNRNIENSCFGGIS